MCHDRTGTFVSWAGTPKVVIFTVAAFTFPSALWKALGRSCLPLLIREAVPGRLTQEAVGRFLHSSKQGRGMSSFFSLDIIYLFPVSHCSSSVFRACCTSKCYLAGSSNKWLQITCSPDRPVSLASASSSAKVMRMLSYGGEVEDPSLGFPAERVSSHCFTF